MIKIVGLGPGSEDDLTIKSLNIMKSANTLYLRTEKHPNVEYIKNLGINFQTFDCFYEKGEKFEEVYNKIAAEIMKYDDVVYAVPGHPLVAEKSVQLIIEQAKKKGTEIEIVSAISFIDAVINALKIDPVEGLKIIDGLQLDKQVPDIDVGNLVTQVYSKFVAANIKIKLMEHYDDEQEVYLIRAAGVPGLERIQIMSLYEIDRVNWVDYLTSLYIPPVKNKKRYNFNDLLNVMDRLRSEEGCPWDREQNHETLKKYLIEESYEVVDAIDKEDMEGLSEELGDVLFQVVFHSQIGKEFGEFDIRDVIHGVTNKMITRHSHVFGEDKCETSADVLLTWDRNKKKEKNINSYTEDLKSIPRSLPALIRSYKLQEKAAKIGFDWEDVEGPISKVHEELNEFLEVYKSQEYDKIIEEMGDLLFSIVNVCKFMKIDPELALTGTINKFIERFEYMEKESAKIGKNLDKMTLTEMDMLWNNAKCK
jgi:tetrapyrrole methylase family protein/MazG family protein